MPITDFGKAIRTARIQTDTTLQDMAQEMGASPAFLSAMETGRKKIPEQWIEKIEAFFAARNYPLMNIRDLAVIANDQVSVAGLSPAQQMMVAGFARTNLDAEQLKSFEVLLREAMKG